MQPDGGSEVGADPAAQPSGWELSRRLHAEVVAPLLEDRWPDLPYAAGLFGPGSEVLGLDDSMSRDHDWGPRLDVVVEPEWCAPVVELLDSGLPQIYAGLPVPYERTGTPGVRHRVGVTTAGDLAVDTLGFDPLAGVELQDWLSLTGQAVLELSAGPVFLDPQGDLGRLRAAVAWYPHDLWLHLLACDWQRVDQELPLLGRAGQRGDDLGSRVIGARLVDVAVHLGFLLERHWAPYPKWRGTAFARLPRVSAAAPELAAALAAETWQERQDHLGRALDVLASVQGATGPPTVEPAVVDFWDRPFRRVDPALVPALRAGILDAEVRALPLGLGSIEQRSSTVDLLVDPDLRRAHLR